MSVYPSSYVPSSLVSGIDLINFTAKMISLFNSLAIRLASVTSGNITPNLFSRSLYSYCFLWIFFSSASSCFYLSSSYFFIFSMSSIIFFSSFFYSSYSLFYYSDFSFSSYSFYNYALISSCFFFSSAILSSSSSIFFLDSSSYFFNYSSYDFLRFWSSISDFSD